MLVLPPRMVHYIPLVYVIICMCVFNKVVLSSLPPSLPPSLLPPDSEPGLKKKVQRVKQHNRLSPVPRRTDLNKTLSVGSSLGE